MTSLKRILFAAAVAGLATSQAIAAPKLSPRPVHAGSGCLNNSRLLSHVAYTPDTSMPAKSCGHLLSTDTVIRGDHWNRT